MREYAQLKQCRLGRALGKLVQKIIVAKFGGEVGWIWLEGANARGARCRDPVLGLARREI